MSDQPPFTQQGRVASAHYLGCIPVQARASRDRQEWSKTLDHYMANYETQVELTKIKQEAEFNIEVKLD